MIRRVGIRLYLRISRAALTRVFSGVYNANRGYITETEKMKDRKMKYLITGLIVGMALATFIGHEFARDSQASKPTCELVCEMEQAKTDTPENTPERAVTAKPIQTGIRPKQARENTPEMETVITELPPVIMYETGESERVYAVPDTPEKLVCKVVTVEEYYRLGGDGGKGGSMLDCKYTGTGTGGSVSRDSRRSGVQAGEQAKRSGVKTDTPETVKWRNPDEFCFHYENGNCRVLVKRERDYTVTFLFVQDNGNRVPFSEVRN